MPISPDRYASFLVTRTSKWGSGPRIWTLRVQIRPFRYHARARVLYRGIDDPDPRPRSERPYMETPKGSKTGSGRNRTPDPICGIWWQWTFNRSRADEFWLKPSKKGSRSRVQKGSKWVPKWVPFCTPIYGRSVPYSEQDRTRSNVIALKC